MSPTLASLLILGLLINQIKAKQGKRLLKIEQSIINLTIVCVLTYWLLRECKADKLAKTDHFQRQSAPPSASSPTSEPAFVILVINIFRSL